LAGSFIQNKGPDVRNSAPPTSAEQTLVITPPSRPSQVKPTYTSNPSPAANRPASSPQASNAGVQVQQLAPASASSAPSAYSGQNNMFNGQSSQGTTTHGRNVSSTSSGFTISPRMIIGLLVFLVVVVALVLLLSHRG
jgi:hypothetical protein